MSATIEASPRELANRRWWALAGDKERLDESIGRARRDNDVGRIFELQEQMREIEKKMIQSRASALAEGIREAEAEAARLVEQEAEQLEQLSTINAKLTELRDAAEQLEGDFAETDFALASTRNRLVIIRREVDARRGELREFVDGL